MSVVFSIGNCVSLGAPCMGPGLWISCSCCNCPSNCVYSWDFSLSATDLLAVNSGHQAARSSTPFCCRIAAHRFL